MAITSALKPLDLRDELAATNMKGKNFTFLDDYTKEELGHLFAAAELLEPYSKNQIPELVAFIFVDVSWYAGLIPAGLCYYYLVQRPEFSRFMK